MADSEPAAVTAAQAETASRSARALRSLYLFRTGFSAFWVALVFALASAQAADRTVGWLVASLLVIYPVSDAVATAFDIRSSRVAAGCAQRLNLAIDIAAAVCVLVDIQSSVAAAITAFGAWAILSGAVMIYVGVLRQRPLGGQWPLIVSGAGSVLAGTTFVGWTGSAAAGLGALAQYSAGGAIWYLLTALWLTRAARSRPGPGGVSSPRPGRRSTAPGGGAPG
jgi:uncharacterized membrane protein HdeD (DUF308 family)